MTPDGYDSTQDTLNHIRRVQQILAEFANALVHRGIVHDTSKLLEPEKSTFDRVTPLLKGSTYGSDEYKGFLAEMGPALRHHYDNNSHHPEFHDDGVAGMDLFDLMEMVADWKAAGERHADGSFARSIDVNTKRFNLDPQLASILLNTGRRLGWID